MTSAKNDFTFPNTPFPVLPLRSGVLFPATLISLPVGRKQSLALLKSVEPGALIGLVPQRDPRTVNPGLSDLVSMGTLARVHEVVRGSGNGMRVVVEGLARFHLDALVEAEPYWKGEGRLAEDVAAPEADSGALKEKLLNALKALVPATGGRLETLLASLAETESLGMLADRVASALGLDTEKEIELLLALDVAQRLNKVIEIVEKAVALADVKQDIDEEVRREIGKNQREHVLREQLRAIQKELGEGEEKDKGDDVSALKAKLDKAELPKEARQVADRELKRLESMNPAQAEYNIIRTHLDWIGDLPWSTRAESSQDLDKVSEKLDADHFGLGEVKKRILEHLAVLKVTGNAKGTILCFAGPPGVGKTALGQSIAAATGRPFVRVALGGVRDEAEIRGHRRTYVGALPGRILHALKKAGAKNPVFLLDEVDKVSQSGWGGSPEAALLEVLDPEQNVTFQDHYLELPFDLSDVLFICTVNDLGNLSPPLRDRLEIIDISGYTIEEKLQIAKGHLIPKKLKEHGLAPDTLAISDAALRSLIAGYTRESGVRQLQREITRICRAVTLEIARKPETKPAQVLVGEEELAKYAGKVKFHSEVAERTAIPGVATGLAWTPVGGDILFIETSRMPGKGKLEITGQLGDVMKESARAALSYVRSNAAALGVDPAFLDTQDVHIHVPAGAVPKDGPSAGVTIFTALTSLLTGRKVRSDTAMTGECTLRGRVLPVGGIKEKVLAAHRAGLTRVILPKHNSKDLDEVPAETQKAVEIMFAEDMSQVLEAALEPMGIEPTVLTPRQYPSATARPMS